MVVSGGLDRSGHREIGSTAVRVIGAFLGLQGKCEANTAARPHHGTQRGRFISEIKLIFDANLRPIRFVFSSGSADDNTHTSV